MMFWFRGFVFNGVIVSCLYFVFDFVNFQFVVDSSFRALYMDAALT